MLSSICCLASSVCSLVSSTSHTSLSLHLYISQSASLSLQLHAMVGARVKTALEGACRNLLCFHSSASCSAFTLPFRPPWGHLWLLGVRARVQEACGGGIDMQIARWCGCECDADQTETTRIHTIPFYVIFHTHHALSCFPCPFIFPIPFYVLTATLMHGSMSAAHCSGVCLLSAFYVCVCMCVGVIDMRYIFDVATAMCAACGNYLVAFVWYAKASHTSA